MLRALDAPASAPRPVLLVDELDRADDEFEALLLEVLADHTVTIPELGTIRAEVPPVVVITSNRTRELHDALKRRCLYHWVDHPDREREVAVVRLRAPEAGAELANRVAAAVEMLRTLGLHKPPGLAESVDWARALTRLGVTNLTTEVVDATLGVVVKSHEDQRRLRAHGMAELVEAVSGG
ncbi:MAG: MoxR family ATPase [Acidimicrobiia bacterium]|nr:MoxR family ATPase [Acidimicrobiia bacterium]